MTSDGGLALALRVPAPADAEILACWFPDPAALRRFAGDGVRWPLDRAQLDAWHADPAIRAWTAEEPGAPGVPAGYVQIVMVEAPLGRLARVAVAPAARGRGLGRALVAAAAAEARRLGLRRLRLNVYADNAPARRLYAALGFAEDDADPEPGLVRMALDLDAGAPG